MGASWRVGVWPPSLFTTLSARIPHLHPTKAPQGNRNLSDIEPLSPIPLRPLHSNSSSVEVSPHHQYFGSVYADFSIDALTDKGTPSVRCMLKGLASHLA